MKGLVALALVVGVVPGVIVITSGAVEAVLIFVDPSWCGPNLNDLGGLSACIM